MAAVKKRYKKVDSRWVSKNSKAKLTKVKSGWLRRDTVIEIPISNSNWDLEDERVSPYLLESIVNRGDIAAYGDVDHEDHYKKDNKLELRDLINKDRDTKGLYKMRSIRMENGNAIARVELNKSHKLYDKYFNYNKQGKYLYASIELDQCDIVDGVIVSAEKIGWSITDYPMNDTLAKGTILEA